MIADRNFQAAVEVAILHTPGGQLNGADRAGLMKRGQSMGLTDAQARQVIEALHDRPRHPITRGIE